MFKKPVIVCRTYTDYLFMCDTLKLRPEQAIFVNHYSHIVGKQPPYAILDAPLPITQFKDVLDYLEKYNIETRSFVTPHE